MRRYGSGSIFQRGKKKIWYYQLWVDGRQIGPLSSKSTDRKVAERQLDKLLGKRGRGELKSPTRDKETVGSLLDAYIEYARERLLSHEIVKCVIENSLRPMLGKCRLAQCDVHRLRRYRGDRKAAGVNDATCNRELSYLRAAWRRALKEGEVSIVPYFPITKENNARQGFTEETQFLKLLGELPESLKAFACCAYFVGMRRGELLRLKLADIDWAQGFLEVRKSKNGEPRAVPILDGPMRDELENLWKRRLPDQENCFVWDDGRPLTPRNWYDEWIRATERARMPGFLLHDCRRSANRNMRNATVPRSVRKKVMGHKTDSMDERYGIVDFEDAAAVKEIMARKQHVLATQTTAKTTACNPVRRSKTS
jgi:integrase